MPARREPPVEELLDIHGAGLGIRGDLLDPEAVGGNAPADGGGHRQPRGGIPRPAPTREENRYPAVEFTVDLDAPPQPPPTGGVELALPPLAVERGRPCEDDDRRDTMWVDGVDRPRNSPLQ